MSEPDVAGNEISRQSLVQILEIMRRLATPDSMPELLREVINVGKVAIVAEAGALWLFDRMSQRLQLVTPTLDPVPEFAMGEGWVGRCADSAEISNVPECRTDELFNAYPLPLMEAEVRSVLNIPVLGRDDDVLGVMQWLGENPNQFDAHDEWVGPALAAQAALAIEHSHMTDELLATAILNQEVAVARDIQMSTLPQEMPDVPGYDVYGYFLPADYTGGDLFDLVVLDDQLFMLLGDATGHGFGPALSATQMQAMLRVAFRYDADLDKAYMHVNNQMEEDLPDDRFITAFIGFLDYHSHLVKYHSPGQGPILHYRAASGACDWHRPTNPPVGVMLLDGSDTAHSLELAPGDILALISDGIYEYANEDDELFGEERVAEIIHAHHDCTMKDLTERVVTTTQAFAGDAGQEDDVTVVLIKRQ